MGVQRSRGASVGATYLSSPLSRSSSNSLKHTQESPLTPRSKKLSSRKWNDAEDKELFRLVEEHGTRNWGLISSKFIARTGKQCRERWYNQLDPNIRWDAW